jgi:hypothetical protein
VCVCVFLCAVRVSMLFGVLREWENKAILSVFHLLSSRGKFLAFF